MKKLYRSKTDRKLVGVCGGIAEYLNIDPTVVRVVMAAFSCMGGSGFFVYLACALLIPEAPDYLPE